MRLFALHINSILCILLGSSISYVVYSQTIIFKESFSGVSIGSLPINWVIKDGGIMDQVMPLDPDSTWSVYFSIDSNLGQGKYLLIRRSNNDIQDDTIVTPFFDASLNYHDGRIYLGFMTIYDYNNAIGTDRGYVQVWDKNNATWRNVKVLANDYGSWSDNSTKWLQFDITSYTSDSLQIRFIWKSVDDFSWAIDSIVVFSGCTFVPDEQIIVLWNDNNNVIVTYSTQFDSTKFEVVATGSILGTGILVVQDGISPDTILGLSPDMVYDIYFQGYCRNVSTDPVRIKLCNRIISPYIESFSDPSIIGGCWFSSNTNYIYVDTSYQCADTSGYLHISSSGQDLIETPWIKVDKHKRYFLTYKLKEGDSNCYVSPSNTEFLVLEMNNAGWHDLKTYSGDDNITQWLYDTIDICPVSDSIKFRFTMINGNGIEGEVWLLDSFQIVPLTMNSNLPVDIQVDNAFLFQDNECNIKAIVQIVNVGIGGTDTIIWGVRLGNHYFIDTITLPYEFECGIIEDTITISSSIVPLGKQIAYFFARSSRNDVNLNDTFNIPVFIGDRPAYLQLNFVSASSEREVRQSFWKLFYMPDSILVSYTSPGTYTDKIIYVDTVCIVDSGLYRFEAWDAARNGWQGGKYDLFMLNACNDTVIFINNGGRTPNNGSNALTPEAIEYVYIADPKVDYNIVAEELIGDVDSTCYDTLHFPVIMSFVNKGLLPIETVLVGFKFKDILQIDTIIYANGLDPCVIDTHFMSNISVLGRDTLHAWVYHPKDVVHRDDSSHRILTSLHMKAHIEIDIGSTIYANHINWRLFLLPDNYLIFNEPRPPFPYYPYRTYHYTFCTADSLQYRFEARDSQGDGWHGATYKVYLVDDCGEEIIIANNGGVSPENPNSYSQLEKAEIFTMLNPFLSRDITLYEIIEPSTNYACGQPLNSPVTVVIKNQGLYSIDTVYIGFQIDTLIVIDTITYSAGMPPCFIDTFTIGSFSVSSFTGYLTVWATTPNDLNPYNDTIHKKIIAGDAKMRIYLSTGSYAHETFWKLFYMPDSILIARGYPNTYYDHSNYIFQTCGIIGGTYRIEAWGDMWNDNETKYDIYAINHCNDEYFIIGSQMFDSWNDIINVQLQEGILYAAQYFVFPNVYPARDVQLEDILHPQSIEQCTGVLRDSVVITIKNTGLNNLDTIFIGFKVANISKEDTLILTNQITPCGIYRYTIDTISLNSFVGPLHAWTYVEGDENLDNNSKSKYVSAGDLKTYIKVRIRRWGDVVFWRLYYMPDYLLVKKIDPVTYIQDSTEYYDSICTIENTEYLFEAWSSIGSGWMGSKYEIYLQKCDSTIILANNNNRSPDNGWDHYGDCYTEIESMETFTIQDINGIVYSLNIQDSLCFSDTIPINIYIRNLYGDTLQVTFIAKITSLDDTFSRQIMSSSNIIHACINNLSFKVDLSNHNLPIGDYWLTIFANYHTPQGIPIQDTLTISRITIRNNTPSPPLPNEILHCDSSTPAIINATIYGVNNVSYLWNTGETTPIIYTDTSAMLIVKITYDSICILYDSTRVFIGDKPHAEIVGPVELTINDTAYFSANPKGPQYIYYWIDGTTSDSMLYVNNNYGLDTIWLIVSDSMGCTDTAYHIILLTYSNIVIFNKPALSVKIHNEKLYINSSEPLESFELISSDGKVVYYFKQPDLQLNIPISNIPSGTYTIRIKYNSTIYTQKIILP